MKTLLLILSFSMLSLIAGEKYKLISKEVHDETKSDSLGNYSKGVILMIAANDSSEVVFRRDIVVNLNKRQTGIKTDSIIDYKIAKLMFRLNK